ncbi:hypothetical protein DFH07DRAFT_687637, partial [Mycena maculata]
RMHTVKLTSGDESDDRAAIAEIRVRAGQLDVVIATPVRACSSMLRDHWEVNTLGPLVLFQATRTLLLA